MSSRLGLPVLARAVGLNSLASPLAFPFVNNSNQWVPLALRLCYSSSSNSSVLAASPSLCSCPSSIFGATQKMTFATSPSHHTKPGDKGYDLMMMMIMMITIVMITMTMMTTMTMMMTMTTMMISDDDYDNSSQVMTSSSSKLKEPLNSKNPTTEDLSSRSQITESEWPCSMKREDVKIGLRNW